MSTTEAQTTRPTASVEKVNMNLEIDVIPVSDVDRSKQFYERLGWRLDDDVAPLDGLRGAGSASPASRHPGMTTTPSPPTSMPSWNTWTCAMPCWPGTRWAPARSPATWAATGRRGSPRAC